MFLFHVWTTPVPPCLSVSLCRDHGQQVSWYEGDPGHLGLQIAVVTAHENAGNLTPLHTLVLHIIKGDLRFPESSANAAETLQPSTLSLLC